MASAILVDGGFYRRRASKSLGYATAKDRANELISYCWRHLKWHDEPERELYRIYYYDCEPLSIQVYHPYLKENIDLTKTDTYQWARDFYDELKSKRKVALRMGELSPVSAKYVLKDSVQKHLFNGKIELADLTEKDFIDFIFDPLFAKIKPSLMEHIDGLRTCDPRFNS